MILAPTNRRIIRPYDKPSFEHTQRYGLIRGHPLARGLFGCWLFNEGSGNKVFDLSGNGNTGSFSGDPTWIGNAIDFDGDDEIAVAKNPMSGLSQLSVVALVRRNDNNTNGGGIIQAWNGGTQILIRGRSSSNWQFYLDTSAGVIGGDIIAYSANVWEHFAFTYDGAKMKAYKNAVKSATELSQTGAIDTVSGFRIGGGSAGASEYYHKGKIAYVMGFNRPLSASEIALLYREPFCMVQKKAAPVYFFVPIVGGVNYDETGLTISFVASVTKTDNQQMVDTGKDVGIAASVVKTDNQQMLDINKAVTFAASVSETDAQQMVDTSLGVTVAASLNVADTQQMVDTNKAVTFAAGVSEVDSQQMVNTNLGVIFAASITETDTQQMKDLLKAISFAASCSIGTEVYYDASAVVFAMLAFIVLRQHTS